MSLKTKSIKAINDNGCLLVFPIKDKVDPPSLWQALYPRSKMRWDWDETGDDRVVNLWHLMKELSTSGQVIYSKWYQNRATFFSKSIFKQLIQHFHNNFEIRKNLYPEAKAIYRILSEDSPLSTKEIKRAADLQGKMFESLYNRSMKQLFQRGLIVSYGEKDDGAFPSAMMGSTELLFEELYRQASDSGQESRTNELFSTLNSSPALLRQFKKIEDSLITKAP